MLFRIDPGSPVPLGEQIAACVRGAVADGQVTVGQRLPAARELADSLGINVHTVLRGYQRLREEGLIELRRGRGAVISQEASAERVRLADEARHLIDSARRLGLVDEEILDLVRGALTPG
ncbi:GntR family transcriptional regulator [Streptomyces sp. NPDC005438]|uniref:GntR family transcriptional regulator n=1 Tax=Streptomyces sp. NPDC005438 TaxID=3156880 RepID=UPI0033BC9F98